MHPNCFFFCFGSDSGQQRSDEEVMRLEWPTNELKLSALHVRNHWHFVSENHSGGTGPAVLARCLNYPWGGRYHTTNRKPVVFM